MASAVPKLPVIAQSGSSTPRGGTMVTTSNGVVTTPRGGNILSSTKTRYTLTPREKASATGARTLTPRDLQSLSAYIDSNKRLNHKHRVGRAANLIPVVPFERVQDSCDESLGLRLAPVHPKESALDVPLRLAPPEEYHAPTLKDPKLTMGLATRIVQLLKGSSAVPQHWEGEKTGTERDVSHLNGLKDIELRIQVAQRAGNTYKQAISTFNCGGLHYNAGNLERALASFRSCVQLFESLNDAQGVALAQNLIGVCHYRLGDAKSALLHHKKQHTVSGPYCRAVALLNMGVCYTALDEIEFAAQAFSDAHTEALAANDSVLEALAAGNLGLTNMRQGEMREAQGHIERCLEFCSVAGDKIGASVCLLLLGEIYSSVHDYPHAQFYYEHAFRVADEARGADIAEIARVGIGVVRGNIALQKKIVENAQAMGGTLAMKDMLLTLPKTQNGAAPGLGGTNNGLAQDP